MQCAANQPLLPKMKHMKKKIAITGLLLIGLSLYFTKDLGQLFASGEPAIKEPLKSSSRVTIVKQWDLPDELREVSGIAYINEGRFACVQDEDGYIFIYNTAEGRIEQKIPFAGAGDYEGIALAGPHAYIVRSDGTLYEVLNYALENREVKTYKTPLNADHNIEGLTYDSKSRRLLVSVKDEDPNMKDRKGIYTFDLSAKQLSQQPAYAIATHDARYNSRGKKGVRPSDIGIHPGTGSHFIIDGPGQKLLVFDSAGQLQDVSELGAAFAKPEGITFDPAGSIFISNERGKHAAANIMQIVTK